MRFFSENNSAKVYLVLIFLLFFGLLMGTTLSAAPTFDEPAHIAAGLSYAGFKDLRYNPEHPPLVKFLSGLSLRLFYQDLRFDLNEEVMDKPLENNPYVLGEQLFKDNDVKRLLIGARLPSMAIALLGIFLIFQFAREITNSSRRALFPTALFAFELNVLANGALVTTDMALAIFWLGFAYFWRRYWQNQKSRKNTDLLVAGLFFALTLLSKYSAVFIFPLTVLASFPWWWRKWKNLFISIMVVGGIGWLGIWLFYLPFGQPSFIWQDLPEVQQALQEVKSPFLNQLIEYLPLPSYYRYGLQLINHHEAVGQLQFLAGKIGQFNWWWFYLLTFISKTSIVFLGLLGFSVFYFFRRQNKKNFPTTIFFLLLMLSYLLLCMNSSMAFGMRILLPLIIFGSLLISTHLDWLKNQQLAVMIIFFYFLLSLARFPYYFSTVNLMTEVLVDKHQVFIDSNLDWGQDLLRLKKWADQHQLKKITVINHGSLSPEIFGFDQQELSTILKQQGVVAISATRLNLPASIINESGKVQQVNKPYDFLFQFRQIEQIGSFLVFDTGEKN